MGLHVYDKIYNQCGLGHLARLGNLASDEDRLTPSIHVLSRLGNLASDDSPMTVPNECPYALNIPKRLLTFRSLQPQEPLQQGLQFLRHLRLYRKYVHRQ